MCGAAESSRLMNPEIALLGLLRGAVALQARQEGAMLLLVIGCAALVIGVGLHRDLHERLDCFSGRAA